MKGTGGRSAVLSVVGIEARARVGKVRTKLIRMTLIKTRQRQKRWWIVISIVVVVVFVVVAALLGFARSFVTYRQRCRN